MSLLSNLLKNLVPAPALDSPVAELGVAFVSRYADVARTKGRAAVERAVTIPLADLRRLAPHADPAALQAADAALAKAGADLVLLVAGVSE